MTKIIRQVYLYLIMVLSVCLHVFAQSPSFSLSVDNNIFSGKPFNITYTYIGSKNPSNFSNPEMPSGIKVVYGPSVNESMSSMFDNIKGKVSSYYSCSYTYTVFANNPGEYNIPFASIKDENGKILKTKTIKIKVYSAPKSNNGETDKSNNNQNIIFRTILSKQSVYINEPIYMYMKIYHMLDDARPSFDSYPIINGFINVPFTDGSSFSGILGVDSYKGKNYKTISFGKTILVPTQSGNLKIGPIKTNISYTVPVDDANNFFLFGSNVMEKEIFTPISVIEVKPLPEEYKPVGFSGLVGKYDIKLTAEKTEFRTSEAIPIKLTISGMGYLKSFELPKISFPKSFEVYDPKSNYEEIVTDKGINCKKTDEYIVIPDSVGDVMIPSIEVSFFDPTESKYKSMRTEPLHMNIVKGSSKSFSVKVSDSTVPKFIEGDTDGYNISQYMTLFNSIYYWIWYFIIILLGLISVIFLIRYRSFRSDAVQFNASRARKVALRRLRLAAEYVNQFKTDEFYEEIMRSLWLYTSYKLKISNGYITKEKAVSGFKSMGVSDELCEEFVDLINKSESARFSGVQTKDDLSSIYKRSVLFIESVESIK